MCSAERCGARHPIDGKCYVTKSGGGGVGVCVKFLEKIVMKAYGSTLLEIRLERECKLSEL